MSIQQREPKLHQNFIVFGNEISAKEGLNCYVIFHETCRPIESLGQNFLIS